MKNLIFAVCMAVAFSAGSQTAPVSHDTPGLSVAAAHDLIPKTLESVVSGCQKTVAWFRDQDGIRHRVYVDSDGGMFYVETSIATGYPYRLYFDTESSKKDTVKGAVYYSTPYYKAVMASH